MLLDKLNEVGHKLRMVKAQICIIQYIYLRNQGLRSIINFRRFNLTLDIHSFGLFGFGCLAPTLLRRCVQKCVKTSESKDSAKFQTTLRYVTYVLHNFENINVEGVRERLRQ